MAGEDIMTYSGAAAAAFAAAKDQAQLAAKNLFNQYYGSIPNFDMNAMFNEQSGSVNEDAIRQTTSSITPTGRGVLADISRAGAAEEADVISGMRARGFGGEIGGGLMAQRRGLAESMTGERAGAARTDLLRGLAEGLAPIGSSWTEMQQAMIQDQFQTELVKSLGFANTSNPVEETTGLANDSLGDVIPLTERGKYSKKGTPQGVNVPKAGEEKPGQVFRGAGGAEWIYRPQGPSGAGWYRKS